LIKPHVLLVNNVLSRNSYLLEMLQRTNVLLIMLQCTNVDKGNIDKGNKA